MTGYKRKYKQLRAAVVLVLDAEIGDDAVVLRRILGDSLDQIEGGTTNADKSSAGSARGDAGSGEGLSV